MFDRFYDDDEATQRRTGLTQAVLKLANMYYDVTGVLTTPYVTKEYRNSRFIKVGVLKFLVRDYGDGTCFLQRCMTVVLPYEQEKKLYEFGRTMLLDFSELSPNEDAVKRLSATGLEPESRCECMSGFVWEFTGVNKLSVVPVITRPTWYQNMAEQKETFAGQQNYVIEVLSRGLEKPRANKANMNMRELAMAGAIDLVKNRSYSYVHNFDTMSTENVCLLLSCAISSTAVNTRDSWNWIYQQAVYELEYSVDEYDHDGFYAFVHSRRTKAPWCHWLFRCCACIAFVKGSRSGIAQRLNTLLSRTIVHESMHGRQYARSVTQVPELGIWLHDQNGWGYISDFESDGVVFERTRPTTRFMSLPREFLLCGISLMETPGETAPGLLPGIPEKEFSDLGFLCRYKWAAHAHSLWQQMTPEKKDSITATKTEELMDEYGIGKDKMLESVERLRKAEVFGHVYDTARDTWVTQYGN